MTNETLQATTMPDNKILPFGTRLQSARQAMGLERKDIAAQLRLTEKIIIMLEEDKYPHDLPVTFIRGYLRSYSKLVAIPDVEIQDALAPLQPKPLVEEPHITTPRHEEPVTSSNYFIQFVTYLIILTLMGLTGLWWYNHPTSSAQNIDSVYTVADATNRSPRNTSDTNSIKTTTNQDTTALAAAEAAANSPIQINNAPTPTNVAPVTVVNDKPITSQNETAKITSNKHFSDFLAHQNKISAFVESISEYNGLNAFTDLILFAIVALFAIWWNLPKSSRHSPIVAAKPAMINFSSAKSSDKGFVKIIRTCAMVITGLWQDIAGALMTKRAMLILFSLGVIAVGIAINNSWRQQPIHVAKPIVITNRHEQVSTQLQALTSHHLSNNSTVTGLTHLSTPNDGAFNNLANPQIQTNKVVEYLKNVPNDVVVPPQESTPAPKTVARKKIRTHHSVPAYMQAEQNNDDDNDSSDE